MLRAWQARQSTDPSPRDLSSVRAGLPVIRLHDVRHTHATLLVQAGVPVKVVSERLGHATAAFTIETHQPEMPGIQADAAESSKRSSRHIATRFYRELLFYRPQPVDDPDEHGLTTVEAHRPKWYPVGAAPGTRPTLDEAHADV